MMSVLHIDENGHKRVFEVDSVDLSPEGVLTFKTDERITTGKVFIMNSDGKTLVKHEFSKQKEQR